MSSTIVLNPAHTALAPLALATSGRSKSRSDTIAIYPTSPLGVFPPPAPCVRPLRDRCGFSLSLHIEAPYQSLTKPLGARSPNGNLQPHRGHLPRRRNPKPCFANFKDVKTPVFEHPSKLAAPIPAPAPALPTPLSPPKSNDPQLQAIIPAVWVAFNDTSSRAYEAGFTHIVEICYAKGVAFTGGSAERRWDAAGGVQRLRVVLPEAARTWAGRAALALNGPQLRAARDFIAEALPEAAAALPDQTAVRVLVSTPRGRTTDAMCVLGCYLAFVAGRPAEEILQCIDEEESIGSVWKGEVSGDEMERIEKIARAWSWLSTAGQSRRS